MKKKLADRISRQKKADLVQIFKIIKENNQEMLKDECITDNENGLFLFFHKFSDKTYYSIENYLKQIDTDSETSEEKKKYKPYSNNSNYLNTQAKYSNKEKSIIKKQHYDMNSDENIVYQAFDIDK